MNVRAQAVGMATQTQNVANTIFQQFFPQFLTACGFYAFYLFAAINFALAVFVYFIVPETRRVRLVSFSSFSGREGGWLTPHTGGNGRPFRW